jgi:hypothetical protein
MVGKILLLDKSKYCGDILMYDSTSANIISVLKYYVMAEPS